MPSSISFTAGVAPRYPTSSSSFPELRGAWWDVSKCSLSKLPATSSIWLFSKNIGSGPASHGNAIYMAGRPHCFPIATLRLPYFFLLCSHLRMQMIAFSVFSSFLILATSSLSWRCFCQYSWACFLISLSFSMHANSFSCTSSIVMKLGNPIPAIWQALNRLLLFTLFPVL